MPELNDSGQELIKPDISIKAMLVEEGHSMLKPEAIENETPNTLEEATEYQKPKSPRERIREKKRLLEKLASGNMQEKDTQPDQELKSKVPSEFATGSADINVIKNAEFPWKKRRVNRL